MGIRAASLGRGVHAFYRVIGLVALTAVPARSGIPCPTLVALGRVIFAVVPWRTVIGLDLGVSAVVFPSPVRFRAACSRSMWVLGKEFWQFACLVFGPVVIMLDDMVVSAYGSAAIGPARAAVLLLRDN